MREAIDGDFYWPATATVELDAGNIVKDVLNEFCSKVEIQVADHLNEWFSPGDRKMELHRGKFGIAVFVNSEPFGDCIRITADSLLDLMLKHQDWQLVDETRETILTRRAEALEAIAAEIRQSLKS